MPFVAKALKETRPAAAGSRKRGSRTGILDLRRFFETALRACQPVIFQPE
jgi:hypothetical protein